jgi:hypothetical protein
MNAVEIEEAVSKLAESTFDAESFPFAFLEAFGNKETTLKRLRSGDSNQSDLPGGVLQRNNIHLKVCAEGEVTAALAALRESAATTRQKAKFILATDGKSFEAENLVDGETVACSYTDLSDHFGFFLPLAGITTVKQIRENAFDIKATSRLNRLYVELLKDNPDWATDARREALNHFMARLIFCFFAEDTSIFSGERLFTAAIEQMSARDSSDTHLVLSELFRAMNTKLDERATAKIKSWANGFPYVNGGLFSDSIDTPRFSKIARSYLLHVGNLDWTKINPDIFGSMIQAVADDEERGTLGMHYTSVPNILKVLNPLFLDELRDKLADAGDNPRKLLNLRQRLARIRVFDPACGSGNFLVIAYKELRAIEAEVSGRRGEADRHTEIPKENFRGIELRGFSCEIARLALIIAEYQCDVHYRGHKLALAEFLPLQKDNWIVCHNALRIDWLSVCPPTSKAVKLRADDLFESPLDQAEIDFKNEGGETYICGNPPYVGSNVKPPKGATKEQRDKLKKEAESRKADMRAVFEGRVTNFGTLDYVCAWVMKAVDYGQHTLSAVAFVTTNSVCQGQQVPVLWPLIFATGHHIAFAHTSFKWRNLAANNAGVTVVIVGLSKHPGKNRRLFVTDKEGSLTVKDAENINAYLVPARNVIVEKSAHAVSDVADMSFGNMPNDGGGLLLKNADDVAVALRQAVPRAFIRPFLGSDEAIDGKQRYCFWVSAQEYAQASRNSWLADRFAATASHRSASDREATKKLSNVPYRFGEVRQVGCEVAIVIPRHSSENREYLPFALCNRGTIVADSAFALYDAPLWNVAIYSARLHIAWVATICGALETRYRYSNTLGWNTFPVPRLTEQNKTDLTRCAEDILLAREAHFPATIAELYDPETMPANLRAAHERNDETLERVYIGRCFRNDTERLERLFSLYTEMTVRKHASAKNTGNRKNNATHA